LTSSFQHSECSFSQSLPISSDLGFNLHPVDNIVMKLICQAIGGLIG
jgi:hypothetical protein